MTTDIDNTLTPIQKFYSGTNIFITGATGFLGRLLIEKLLRSCPDLGTIYILIRGKKDKTPHERLDELFDNIVFDRLRQECPKFRHRLIGIQGDCTESDLGLSVQDRRLIVDETDIVFHVAATVRFDEKLRLAMATNVHATIEIMRLCKMMRHLKACVHVSTAYTNPENDKIMAEKIYDTPMDLDKIQRLLDAFDDKQIKQMLPTILDKWPNTYTFTKAIGECAVMANSDKLPVAIFRPAIIISTYREPIPAWINNFYGPTGVSAGAGVGLLRTLHCDPQANANIVPADMCVNAMIATAVDINRIHNMADGGGHEGVAPPRVYHYESSVDRPITWGRFMDLSARHGLETPSINSVWYYTLTLQPTYVGYLITSLFLHYIPALLIDSVLFFTTSGPKLLKVYRKMQKFSNVISYFCTRSWQFKSINIRHIIDHMDERDKKIYFCDLKQLEWEEFFKTYIKGLRIFVLNDPIDTLDEAKIKWKRLYYLHQTVKVIISFIIIRFLWWFLQLIFFSN